ncbi:MAG: carbamate kinase [Peptococcaceae bacterium]|nr:carbamate kinase [Peptococcaceae bacterium]
MAGEIIVVALGGNAICQGHQKGTTAEQLENVSVTTSQIAKLIKAGNQVVVTHGNGPQVGDLMVQMEAGKELVPAQTMFICGAMTQGQVGWMMANRLQHHLEKMNINKKVAAVVTQMMISNDDPDFKDPSKPVGVFYTKEEAHKLKDEMGYTIKEVKPGAEKGWRRVVPSPDPIEIIESEAIATLVNNGFIVVADGGGGIPVRRDETGNIVGVDAVIDKDLGGVVLSKVVNADKFVILTDVEKACLNYGKPDQKELGTVTLAEMEKYYNDGHFMKGSMGPKVMACMRFVKDTGKDAIITSLHKVDEAMEGKTGTRITP